MNKKEKREVELLTELQQNHGYVLFRIKKDSERRTTLVRRRGKTLAMEPATAIKLVVPESSALAKAFATLYDKPKKPTRKAGAK